MLGDQLKTMEMVVQCFGNHADFVTNSIVLLEQTVIVCYLESLVDYKQTQETLNIMAYRFNDLNEAIYTVLLPMKGSLNRDSTGIIDDLLNGKMAVFLKEDGSENITFDPAHPSLERSISEPQAENVLQSSFDAFTENLSTNIGLIRKQLKNKDLVIKTFPVGKKNPCNVGLFYVKNKANPNVIQQIETHLQNGKDEEAYNIQELTKVLGLPRYSLIPTYLSTELTAETMHDLLDGKAIVMVDHFPIALSLPVIISDFWAVKVDKNQPILFMQFYRLLRIIGMIVTLLMPALYVAIVSVNPEVLRIQLGLSVAQSREGVPYPALVEVLLMMIIMEMVVEASIRLPKSIGPTITMVGGIVLGQAVVQAKLVSNLLIIILAATMIANLTLAGYQNAVSVRITKYVILFLSSMYGVIGIAGGVVWLCFYLGGITTYQVPFLSYSMKENVQDE